MRFLSGIFKESSLPKAQIGTNVMSIWTVPFFQLLESVSFRAYILGIKLHFDSKIQLSNLNFHQESRRGFPTCFKQVEPHQTGVSTALNFALPVATIELKRIGRYESEVLRK